jgi:hypothetical protein
LQIKQPTLKEFPKIWIILKLLLIEVPVRIKNFNIKFRETDVYQFFSINGSFGVDRLYLKKKQSECSLYAHLVDIGHVNPDE